MSTTSESIHVTMHVLSRQTADALNTDAKIRDKVDAALNELMQPVKNGAELAKRLSLPAHVPIQWDVRIAALNEGFKALEGHIPIMVSLGGVPSLMEKLSPQVVEEVTNLIFAQLTRKSTQSQELATTLGYETDKPARFHLYLPQQVNLRAPATGLQGDGGDVGASGSWSKGCSSWPW